MLNSINEKYIDRIQNSISLQQFIFFFVYSLMFNYIYVIDIDISNTLELKKSFFNYYMYLTAEEVVFSGKYSIKNVQFWTFFVSAFSIYALGVIYDKITIAAFDFLAIGLKETTEKKFNEYKLDAENENISIRKYTHNYLYDRIRKHKHHLSKIKSINEVLFYTLMSIAIFRLFCDLPLSRIEITTTIILTILIFFNILITLRYYYKHIYYQFILSSALLHNEKIRIEESYIY